MSKLVWTFERDEWTAPFKSLIFQVIREDAKSFRVRTLVFATKIPAAGGPDLVLPRLDLAWRFGTLYSETMNIKLALRELVDEQ
jgi:hypothetical protein